VSITGAEVKIAVDLMAKAQKEGWLDRLIDWFKKKHQVLVLGTTGTGKTNFIKSLSDLMPEAIDRMNRTQHLKDNSIKINQELFVFKDTPGQVGHSPIRMDAYRDAQKEGIEGIINVVSYGYHEGKGPTDEVFDQNGNVKPEFLAGRRTVELEAIREWGIQLGTGPSSVANWIMTVATKADLWWSNKDAVLGYYESGEYQRLLTSFHAGHSSVLPYCSVVHRFYNIGSISGEFDAAERNKLREHLLHELFSAIGK
jgi:energy-coupling factor transporter ATP-binding protein EcfA2